MSAHATHDDPRRRFLTRVPASMQAMAANSFVDATRAGATTVPDVQRYVERFWLRRLDAGTRVRDGLTRRRAQTILDKLMAHPDEAADLAAWALDWARMPAPERTRLKRDLGAQAPTPRQVAYARLLGYDGPLRSKREATRIIDVLKARGVA